MNHPFLTKSLPGLRPVLRSARALLVLCAGMTLHGSAAAQCANSLYTRTYDTLLTGPGYGTYQLSFPQWNADSGLLVSVKINALVNVQYSFTLKNVDAVASSYSLWVGREDYFTSPALTAAYDNITEQKIGVYSLNPGAQVSMPSFAFLNNYNNIDSITSATAPFLGTGKVNFTYSPITYTTIHASNNASYSYHATATDATHFSISYIYCNAGIILAQNLTAFTARLKDPGSVQLDWKVTGDDGDKLYEIQRSPEGQEFVTVGALSSRAGSTDYTYVDHPAGADYTDHPAGPDYTDHPAEMGARKWYYRLRIITPGGISYSPVKEVALDQDGNPAKLTIYPNPAVSHINLVLPGDPSRPGDWRVDILTSDGRLVQRAEFFHTNSFFINFRQHLSPGVYFIRATDLLGHGLQMASFRVDGQ